MHDAIHIRAAVDADADAISALARQTFADAFGRSMSAADLRAHLDRELSPASFADRLVRDVLLVAEREGDFVGYAQFGKASDPATPEAEAELKRLYVRSDLHGRGIGAALMDAALAHPVLANADAIELDVWIENEGAQRFYRRYGFETVGERSFAVASGDETTPDLIMARRRP